MVIEVRGLMFCVRMFWFYCVVVLLFLVVSFVGVVKVWLLDGDVMVVVVSKNKEFVVLVFDFVGGVLLMKEEEYYEISI